MKKKKWFSITANDCKWQYFRGSGDGGQKRQKTSSGARCIHEPSGAVGEATDTRWQHKNRELAFKRMFDTQLFQSWLSLKIDAGQDKVLITEQDDQGNIGTRHLRIDEV